MTPMSRAAGGPDAVFVGASTFDALALVDSYPGPDERRIASELVFSGGGPAATAAVTFARLGLRAAFIGAVGDDPEGDRVRKGLEDEGVDVSALVTVHGRPTGASVVLIDRGRAARAIVTRPVPPLRLDPGDPGAALVRSAAWVHVDHLGWGPVSALLQSARSRPRLSVDGGNPIEGFQPTGVDLYVPTEGALRRSYGDAPLEALLAAAVADGARAVVASRGADGSVASDGDGRIVAAPALRLDILSTLGAGDVFHGALLAAVVRGEPLDRCLAYANAVAGLSCRGLDGRVAIPDHATAVAAALAGHSPAESAAARQQPVP
jgi:sulfofructose kinase